MQDVATLTFSDNETGEKDLVIVRADENQVILAVSQETNGDVQIVLSREDCRGVVAALHRALALCEEQT